MFRLNSDIEEKVLLYQSTEEGKILWDILNKVDKCCSQWMNAFEYRKMKKELFIQLYEFHYLEDNA